MLPSQRKGSAAAASREPLFLLPEKVALPWIRRAPFSAHLSFPSERQPGGHLNVSRVGHSASPRSKGGAGHVIIERQRGNAGSRHSH